jgi:hypothetical protein
LHNATELEKLGIPTAVLCTEPFDNTAKSMARRRGFANYRYVLVEHPLSSARPEGIKQRAQKALPEVISILLGEGAEARSVAADE